MESRAEKAAALKKSGACNCAQAIACTYCDLAGADEETLRHAAQAFGFGMGTLDATCGALIGAGLVLGMANKDRAKTVRQMREIINAFKAKNGTVTCCELKGVGTGVVLRECVDCVRDAAELLESKLDQTD